MKKKIFAAAIASVASVAMAQTVNTSIWFDGTDQQVNTGGYCKYDYETCDESTMGYWYDYDDRKNDKGGSYAVYPYETSPKDEAPYYGSYIQPMIENLGYATIKYVLVEPTTTGQTEKYPYNFVGFGFNTVNGTQDPLDITAAGGLCATYTADHNVTLEVMEATSGDNACFVTLKKSATPTMADFAIADFAQPSYTKTNNPERVIDCAQAFAAAKAVKFKIDGGAAAFSGQLRIFAIGPKGTCPATGTIAAEPASFACKSDGVGGATCDGSAEAIKAVKAASSVKATLTGRTLSFSGINDGKFEVVSLQGQVVKSGKISSSVSLANINAGVYMVRVSGKSVNMSQKILVK